MPSYTADQIIYKTLVARIPVPLKRAPSDTAKTIYTVQPGESVGVVYSYTGGNEKGPVWWMFYDENQNTYYVKHATGAFDVGSLRDQGALTVQEVTEAQKQKDEGGGGLFDGLGKDLKKTITIGAYVVAGALALSLLRKP